MAMDLRKNLPNGHLTVIQHAHQLERWGELGSRDVPLNQFTASRWKELLTNFQVDQLIEGGTTTSRKQLVQKFGA
jgi:hypothetical protein